MGENYHEFYRYRLDKETYLLVCRVASCRRCYHGFDPGFQRRRVRNFQGGLGRDQRSNGEGLEGEGAFCDCLPEGSGAASKSFGISGQHFD